MRVPVFARLLAALIVLAAVVLFAPYIGLGKNEAFILYKLFGISRAEALDSLSLFMILLFLFHWRHAIIRAAVFTKIVAVLVALVPLALLAPYVGLEGMLAQIIGINGSQATDWLVLLIVLVGVCQIMTLDIVPKEGEPLWIAAARATRRAGLPSTDPLFERDGDIAKPRQAISHVTNIELYSIAFLTVLFFGFKNNLSCLYISRDGAFVENQLSLRAMDHPLFSQYGPDPLQGNFDAIEPVYRDYILPDMLTTLMTGGNPAKPTVFVVYAAIMVLSVYLLGRAVRIERGISMFGAFLCPLLILPSFIGFPPRLHGYFAFLPFVSQQMAFALVLIACFWKLEQLRFGSWLLLTLVATLSALCAFLSAPWTIAIMMPVTLFFIATSFFVAPNWRAIVSKLLAGFCIIVAMAILGIIQFAYALYSYNATRFFSPEMFNDRLSIYFASILYHPGPGKMVIVTAMVGAFYAVFTGSNRLRIFAAAFLVYTTAFQFTALVVNRFATGYVGPSPLYFEYLLWPFYLIFCAITVFAAMRWLLMFLSLALSRVSARWITVVPRRVWHINLPSHAVLIITICFLSGENTRASINHTDNCTQYVYIDRPTKITEYLRGETELKPGVRFRGLTATFTGYQNTLSTIFDDFGHAERTALSETHNEHRSIGLWMYRIPTLFQGSSFMTPAYYFFLTEFFTRPQDRQTRGVVMLTRPNPPLLQLLGARFVITDFDPGFGALRVKIPLSNGRALRLIELDDPNLGQYSPTEVSQVNDFHSAAVALHNSLFDGRRTVVTDRALLGDLVPAHDVELIFVKLGFSVSAKSTGRSVIVLPVQYSHCWKISGSGNPFLFRANILQLAIGFEGALHANLEFHFEPFSSPQCRLDDLKDMERLHMRSARLGR
jgi:hypothetical protein